MSEKSKSAFFGIPNDKPSIDDLIAPPDKNASELEAVINQAQKDLKKANERLVLLEQEKAKALRKVMKALKLSDEENKKLREALVAQKQAEEKSEIEKFRAVECSKQAGIKLAHWEKEKWQKVLETVKNEHALDLASLLSANQELEKAKQELAMAFEEKVNLESCKLVKAEVERKELYLINSVKRCEEEKSCMEFEINRLTNLLKRTEKDGRVAWEQEARWKKSFQEANSEAIRLKEREMALLVKVEALTNFLVAEKKKNSKQEEEYVDCEKDDYDLWMTSFMRVSVNEKHAQVYEVEGSNGEIDKKDDENEGFEMWESFEIDENDSYTEIVDDGGNSPSKKKRALLGKIGSLLKKGNSDQK